MTRRLALAALVSATAFLVGRHTAHLTINVDWTTVVAVTLALYLGWVVYVGGTPDRDAWRARRPSPLIDPRHPSQHQENPQ